jgi:hypothetical protein
MGRKKHHKSKSTNVNDNFNAMIEHAQKSIGCDSNCQREKEIKHLKEKYLESKEIKSTAPEREKHAFKQYFEFAHGSQKYAEVIKEKSSIEADKRVVEYSKHFNEEIKEIEKDIIYVAMISKNYENLLKYKEDLLKNNKKLQILTKTTKADIITNDRKTFYENQGIESLDYYYTFIKYIYICCILGFCVCIFAIPTNMPTIKKIGILVGFVLYPFVSEFIVRHIVMLINNFYSYLPGSAYKEITPSNNRQITINDEL